MPVKIAIAQIQLDQGQRVTLEDINWQEFEDILEDLGEHRHSLIAYYKGVLEIRMPLAGHERIKVLIGDFLKIILDELGLEWESLGSTTFKSKKMQAGIEPDDCFYIQNYQAMIGKQRLDLDIDPVPDLAIEVDLTSITQISAYEALAVPEIWRYKNGKLEISLFEDGKYLNSSVSKAFPSVLVIEGISLFLEKSKELPMSVLRREFRLWLQTLFITKQ
ncbi:MULTISPECIES: Uma2 family endonuclease [Pseudanabaena]|uniref:Uma2 family endonuclease n=1 Tax=Pseudanabaena TaxID=1152 RepID=UPI002479FBB4|nr:MULTISPECIES: Uma2 family endonuclease [Pseudanabaena]MEA5489713.1 Uma2 family endonuclease [Pseudanabaena sp. CCNP1317]WGS73872.1 Uma2 family endonuclease [Pseudanabaena galeata CCNP1313]